MRLVETFKTLTHLESGEGDGLGGHPATEGGGRLRAWSLHLRLLPSGSADVLVARLPGGQDLAFQEVVVSVPVSFPLAPLPALSRCHGDDSLSLAV